MDDSYQAYIDEIFDEDDICDSGDLVRDLLPIGDCILSPGDPSPAGRTEEGDLAYVIPKTYDYLRLTRKNAADMVCLIATSLGVNTLEALNNHPKKSLVYTLLEHALPRAFYFGSAHDEVQWENIRQSILSQGSAVLPEKHL